MKNPLAKFNGHWPRISRDGFLFIAGMAGIIHETIFTKIDRPTLLFAYMAMVGLPAFLRSDERKGNRLGVTTIPEPEPEPAPQTIIIQEPAKTPVKRAPRKKKAPPHDNPDARPNPPIEGGLDAGPA